jgi:hypothetical protein
MVRASGTGTAFRPARRQAVRGCLAFILAAVLASGGASGTAWAQDRKPLPEATFFRIGTAGTAGTYFQIGGLIANALSSPPGKPDCTRSNGPSGGTGPACGVPGLIAVAQATQGSVENVQLVASGRLESALSQADVATWAHNGGGMFAAKPPLRSLRAIASLYPEAVHIVARRDGPIRTLADLKGRRVALGEPESGTLADARLILEGAGLRERDVHASYLRLGQASAGLAEGQIDAFFLVGGAPVPGIADLAATKPLRMISVPDDVADRLKNHPPARLFERGVIAQGAYDGIGEDVGTLTIRAIWLTSAEIPESLIYDVTRAFWSDATQRILATQHLLGKQIRLSTALAGIGIPLHPGAERYYREIGIAIGTPAP